MKKTLRKLLAMMLAVTVLASLGVTAAAAGPLSGNGTMAAAGDTPADPNLEAVRETRAVLAELNQQQKALRQQTADLMRSGRETMRSITAAVKDQVSAARGTEDGQEVIAGLLEALNTLRSQIQTLKAQMSALTGDAHAIQAQISLKMNDFLAAMKDEDYVTANAVLSEIIPLKEQVIATTEEILGLGEQAAELLSGFLSGLGV